MARKPKPRVRMTKVPKRSLRAPSLPHIDLSLVAAERAAGDLRRGLPVIVVPSRGRPSLIAAAELANTALIAALKAWTKRAPHVLLTHNRARTLKMVELDERELRLVNEAPIIDKLRRRAEGRR